MRLRDKSNCIECVSNYRYLTKYRQENLHGWLQNKRKKILLYLQTVGVNKTFYKCRERQVTGGRWKPVAAATQAGPLWWEEDKTPDTGLSLIS